MQLSFDFITLLLEYKNITYDTLLSLQNFSVLTRYFNVLSEKSMFKSQWNAQFKKNLIKNPAYK